MKFVEINGGMHQGFKDPPNIFLCELGLFFYSIRLEATRLIGRFYNKTLDKGNVDSVWVDLANKFKSMLQGRLSIQYISIHNKSWDS